MPEQASYGEWRSPISLDALVAGALVLAYPLGEQAEIYWVERRPAEGGRQVVVRSPLPPAGSPPGGEDVFGSEFNARTTVHEYGGLSYAVKDRTVYFVNFTDQRLYRVEPGGEPLPLTPEPPRARAVRYGAPVVSPDGRFLFAVRERHADPDLPDAVLNDLVVLSCDGRGAERVIAGGRDFYSHPTPSPDGSRLSFVCWDHPNMPWNGTELWELELAPDMSVAASRLVAGGHGESVTQPKYSPAGVLHYLSDRSDWWLLYREEPDGSPALLAELSADIGVPDWVFGRSTYAFLADGGVVLSYLEAGFARLALLRAGGALERIDTSYVVFDGLQPAGDGTSVLAIAGGPAEPQALVRIVPGAAEPVTRLRLSRPLLVDPSYLSMPEAIEFQTGEAERAHAFFHPPHNPDFSAPPGELPPLIVQCHGGPTSAVLPALDYEVQFWTSRGIGVVEVNYRGSTGYGRAYRERLRESWGVVDVEDCAAAASYLAATGRADPARLAIHGGSAGGYTALLAVALSDVFAAAASYYGVADLVTFAETTHKFEARYLEFLIGPWPEARARYVERSPVTHVGEIAAPLILFQGLEDKVVPPEQAETMAAALARRGVPYAYVAYEGEQHGFRRAENLRRTNEAELFFYGAVFGFEPADELTPVPIENAAALPSL